MIDPSLAASAAISAVNFLSSATGGATETPAPKPNDVVNQADFMKLLVAQLSNQDPLNPLDSANFSAQLAQFSSLQQLTEINQHLVDQAKPPTGSGAFDAVDFLGRDVRAATDDVNVTGGVASGLDYELEGATIVQAKILDEGGREIASLVLGTQAAGTHHFDLASVPNAPQLGDGHYHVRLSTPGAAGTSTPIETTVSGRVDGVDLAASPPVLLVDGRRVALADVREIHVPNAAGPAA